MDTFGMRIVRELRKRKLLGSFFNFAGYRTLKSLDSVEEVRAFLKKEGYDVGAERVDEIHIVDFLAMEAATKALRRGTWMELWYLLLLFRLFR